MTLTANVTVHVPGGKGCNQAIAASNFLLSGNKVQFLGQFGKDEAGNVLRSALEVNGVDVSLCNCPPFCRYDLDEEDGVEVGSGRGYVFLQSDGSVSAVVDGGANLCGWWAGADGKDGKECMPNWIDLLNLSEDEDSLVLLLLQREVPDYVNLHVVRTLREQYDSLKVVVMQDVGGEDRPMSREMLEICDFLTPNASELQRLVSQFDQSFELNECNEASVIKGARLLQAHGAKNVLVTLGERGCILVFAQNKESLSNDNDSNFIQINSCLLPDRTAVVDETGAGDCFRAGFAVSYAEGNNLTDCLKFASAAGALAVTRKGAVPSIPSRFEVENLLKTQDSDSVVDEIPRGGGVLSSDCDNGTEDDIECPLLFGSRLNSMKDRTDLWNGEQGVRGWVKRQATVRGLGCIDFNFPQHFESWSVKEAKEALVEAGLVAGAVCLRYPHGRFQQGAMTHPDTNVRQEAIEITKQAALAARELGAKEVVVWSAYDGYDYTFQVDYVEKWDQIVHAFQDCCDSFPDIKFSLEFKPTDENTRFFAIPSTGAAMLLVNDIDRPNMGLTLDVGHMLMAGENPGQSIALVGAKSKLFGIQLNDGYTRLAAEDGMMFGSVHPAMALEIIYYLQKYKYDGHIYFDTFPQRSDPVKEAEYNIQRVKQFWRAAKTLKTSFDLESILQNHDAIGSLNMIEDAIYSSRKD